MTITIAPATPQNDPDAELRRAVAVAYRTVRQRGELHYPAWLATRAAAMELRPGMTEEEAGRRVTAIISWVSREHTTWFWKSTGEPE